MDKTKKASSVKRHYCSVHQESSTDFLNQLNTEAQMNPEGL
jgi:hypothetical protein